MPLDESLYDRTRHEAIRQGRQIADVVCDALAEYLDSKATFRKPAGVVAETWGKSRAARPAGPGVARRRGQPF